MRPFLSRDLAVLIVAIAIFRAPVFAGGPKPKMVHRSLTPVETFKVMGIGVDEDLAKKNALDELRTHVTAWLADKHPEIAFLPALSPAELEGMVREWGECKPWKRPQKKDAADVLDDPEAVAKNDKPDPLDQQPMVQIALKAELTDADVRSFQSQSRQQVAQQRQGLMARVLLGAVALLLVGTGYLRLEEKVGRHKRKLGMVALGILGVVGLVLLALSI